MYALCLYLWRRKAIALCTLISILLLGQAGSSSAQMAVDAALPSYTPVSGVTGNLNSIGSDTMNNLMTLWAERFRAFYPNVNVQIEGKGSSTAPPALIEGTAQLGPMSRPMKAAEVDKFEQTFGYKPTAFRTAIDALAVFVHKDNPITCLTLTQVDSIFSKTYKRGGRPLRTWGDLGLRGTWATRAISLYGRNSASGTYGFLKDHVLLGGDYKDTVKEQPGSSSVVQGIASDLGGIGYSGIGYRTSGVKAVALADDGTCYAPTVDNVMRGDYPLARFLYLYVNKKPGKPLDRLVAAFIRFVFSREGQEVVIKAGYHPIPATVAQAELAKLAE